MSLKLLCKLSMCVISFVLTGCVVHNITRPRWPSVRSRRPLERTWNFLWLFWQRWKGQCQLHTSKHSLYYVLVWKHITFATFTPAVHTSPEFSSALNNQWHSCSERSQDGDRYSFGACVDRSQFRHFTVKTYLHICFLFLNEFHVELCKPHLSRLTANSDSVSFLCSRRGHRLMFDCYQLL